MPTSDCTLIPHVVNAAFALRPKSVIELGIGVGKYGSLLREYLDWGQGRLRRWEWQTRLIGVEGFESYWTANWDNYDSVWIENFTTCSFRYQDFDLVLMVDSLEHVEYEVGKELILTLKKQNKHLLISTPAPLYYAKQGAVYGNTLEVHRHKWTPAQFKELGGTLLHSSVCQLFRFEGEQR